MTGHNEYFAALEVVALLSDTDCLRSFKAKYVVRENSHLMHFQPAAAPWPTVQHQVDPNKKLRSYSTKAGMFLMPGRTSSKSLVLGSHAPFLQGYSSRKPPSTSASCTCICMHRICSASLMASDVTRTS